MKYTNKDTVETTHEVAYRRYWTLLASLWSPPRGGNEDDQHLNAPSRRMAGAVLSAFSLSFCAFSAAITLLAMTLFGVAHQPCHLSTQEQVASTGEPS
eukprot:6084068-Amphidinium_carterae.1